MKETLRRRHRCRASRLHNGLCDISRILCHAIAETNEDLMALISAAPNITGPGILIPTRKHALFSLVSGKPLESGLPNDAYEEFDSTAKPVGVPSVLY